MEAVVPVEEDMEEHARRNAEFEMMDKAIAAWESPVKVC